MKLISFLWKISPRHILLATVCGIISGASSTLLIVLINRLLDRTNQTSELLLMGFAALCLLNLISAVTSQILLITLSEGAVYDMRMKLTRGILMTPLRKLEQLGSHRLLTTLTEDIRNLNSGLLCVPVIGVQMIVIAGCLVYLGWLSLPLLAFVIGFMALAVISYHLPARFALNRLKKAREKQDTLFKHFEAVTHGTKELKLNRGRRHLFFSTIFEPTAQLYRSNNILGFSIYASAANWGYMMFFIMLGLLLFFLPNGLGISQTVLTGATLIILYLRAPLETIFTLVPELGRSQVSLEKLEHLGLSLTPELPGQETPFETAPGSEVSFELKNVVHRYHHEGEGQDFLVGPVDLTFYKGEIVFIVGGNGSGKTTLAKILTGLYTPEAGEIIYAGRRVSDLNRDDYRQQFSAVFSDFYLFENLLGLQQGQSEQQLRDYITQFQLHHKVKVNDGKFSTLDLSQGQRKRLALITAYLEDRPVYLFDEWAADQDPVFKDLFYTVLMPEIKRRGRTVICITHDEKYFAKADRIVKLDYGQVEFVGKHEDFTVAV